MTNRRRGEAAVELGGRRYRLCLTLGGLAELEEAFGAEDVSALSARFATGALSSRDLLKLLAVGLRGGGQALSDAEVAALPLEGGIRGARRYAARGIRRGARKPSVAAGGSGEPSPFPWEEMMAFGLGVLRWSPQEFWRATPRELMAAVHGLRGGPAQAPASSQDLARLMEAFPD